MWPTSSVTGISRSYWQSAGFKLTTQLSIAGCWSMPLSWKPRSVACCLWFFLYRAVDKFGDSIDFMLTEKRDEAAARSFFNKVIGQHGLPEKVVIDKSGSNAAALDTLNWQMLRKGQVKNSGDMTVWEQFYSLAS
ncbi:putative transposase [Photobacterium profundum SS9]|uniref:Transposase n=1 Tax=Photobacterium profundum (strain SS9) TaxID=298386 RepID=Q6LMW5_PHOPR|nr:putative transposase [Photobacterium profundum SS9]